MWPNDIKITGMEKILIILGAILFIIFIVSPVINGIEPSSKIFVAIWIIFAICFIRIFSRESSELYKKHLPYLYKEIRNNYGTPVNSFKVSLLSVGNVRFRGSSAKVDIFSDSIVVSHFGKCLIITDFSCIDIKKDFFCYIADIQVGDAYLRISFGEKQKIMLESKKIVSKVNYD